MSDIKTVRAKFRCNAVTEHEGEIKTVKLVAVSDEANKVWSKWTPNGTLEMQITNPPAADVFKPGKTYFLDLSLADE